LLHRRQIGGGDCIQLGVSREVLANLLGLARETLSRQLSRFSEAGLVELRGKDIVILDVPALQATAAEGDR
jgi:CRP-like cAMP-binding protein